MKDVDPRVFTRMLRKDGRTEGRKEGRTNGSVTISLRNFVGEGIIGLKNEIILLCIEINLKTDKIYSFSVYTREFLTVTVHVYTQSYSCSTILSPFTQPYN